MAGAQQQQAPQTAGAVQEGNRWVWAQPKPEDFVKWFKENVHLHPEMENTHDRYVQGVVLIGSKEKRKVTKLIGQQRAPSITDEERLVFTPYAKVETRVAYFYDLMAEKRDWLGIIEPVPVAQLGEAGVFNRNMPPGFFRLPIADSKGDPIHYVGNAKRVRILDRSTVEKVEVIDSEFDAEGRVVRQTRRRSFDGLPIAEFSTATKMVSTLGRYGEDPFSLMKAETGAVGRALGMAGMLVIPGSGIATAEDMQEAMAGAGGTAVEGLNVGLESEDTAESARTAAGSSSGDLGEEIAGILTKLEEDFPAKLEEVQAWAREKKLRLSDLSDQQKRSVHRHVVKVLERAVSEGGEAE